MIPKSTRERFQFWLDGKNPIDFEVADRITELKQQRLFTQTIRDGIRLITELRQGKIDLLLELFPFVQTAIEKRIQPLVVPDVQAQLIRLETLLLMQESTQSVNGIKPMAVPQFDAPIFENDEAFALDIRKDTSTDATQNFLNSIMSLQ